jgi:macrolide transport system ATP-binding/permease protein
MRRVRALAVKVRALFLRRRLDRDLAAEIDSHLAHHIDDNLRAGMSPEEARRQALLKLGGIAYSVRRKWMWGSSRKARSP